MIWIDYLKGLVTKPEKVYGIVDSAMFMDPKEVEVVFMMHNLIRQQTNFPAMLSHPAGNRKPPKAPQQGIVPESTPPQCKNVVKQQTNSHQPNYWKNLEKFTTNMNVLLTQSALQQKITQR